MKRTDFIDKMNVLLHEHGLAQAGWTVGIDEGLQTTLGLCRYGTQQVSATGWFIDLNEEDCVMDTGIHEIAHALTPGHSHDQFWRAKCLEIGCSQSVCKTYDEWPNAILCAPDFNYEATCRECGRRHGWTRLPHPDRRLQCDCCNGWKPETTMLVPIPNPNARSKTVASEAMFRESIKRPKSSRLAALRAKANHLGQKADLQ